MLHAPGMKKAPEVGAFFEGTQALAGAGRWQRVG